jgi:hypothetical protein
VIEVEITLFGWIFLLWIVAGVGNFTALINKAGGLSGHFDENLYGFLICFVGGPLTTAYIIRIRHEW